ncbi:thioredoxin fold domain-containing protein [Halobacillus litoralis]|uniref:Thioredoxin fold domain-containing protein n=1 Tax=Halobacillus litoralis TaxID=45668 RepID=A0A845DM13_9BACI|nr:thioredoxin family protein [Halobacillus litoralis]MYL18393.1 thioredoxin fold domain-containing protein [Halobacillus litoralis]
MKKGMIIFASVLAVLVVVLIFVVNYQNDQKTADNPYGKDELDQATINQLDDPNYQNQILPDELEEEIESGDPVTVYFYSPTCPHCQRTTPVLVPMVEDMDIDMKKMNLLEFDVWTAYSIQSTPTLVHYENGEEQARLVGEQPETVFEEFFQDEVLDGSEEE